MKEASLAPVHDSTYLAFRLEWTSPIESRTPGDNDEFADAAAILLPVSEDASVMTMGAPGAPVNAWYWRGDADGGRNVIAEGIGSSHTVDQTSVRTSSRWQKGRWQVVVARAMQLSAREPVAVPRPGETTGFAIAIWDGSNGERAGIKAFSGDWQELRIDAR